jgi:hypothetical protein
MVSTGAANSGCAAGVAGAVCAKAGAMDPVAASAVEPIKYMPKLLNLPQGLLFIVIRSDVRSPQGVGKLPLK